MIYLIAAMTKEGVIGKGNQLPWNIPAELKHFRKSTQGSTVIMGRRTFESIGRPLPNRHNIVLSPPDLVVSGVDVVKSIDQALDVAYGYGKDIFVIGGAQVYAQFLPLVDCLYISYIKYAYEGDVFFPSCDWYKWKEVERVDHNEFEFVVYRRVSNK